MGIYAARFLVYSLQSSPVELGSPYIRLTTFPSSHVASSVSLHLMFVPEFVIDNAPFAQQLLFAFFRRSIWIQAFHFHLFRLRFGLSNAFGPCAILEVLRPRLFFFPFGCFLPCSTTLYHKVFDISIVLRIIIKQDIILCAILLDIVLIRVTMQAYSSTLLQFIFKFQLVYFPYFYDDKVQKNAPIWCIVATKWCIVISQDILQIEKYQPKTRDICLF